MLSKAKWRRVSKNAGNSRFRATIVLWYRLYVSRLRFVGAGPQVPVGGRRLEMPAHPTPISLVSTATPLEHGLLTRFMPRAIMFVISALRLRRICLPVACGGINLAWADPDQGLKTFGSSLAVAK